MQHAQVSRRTPEKGWARRLDGEADIAFRFLNDPEHVLQLEGEIGQLAATEFGAMFGGDNYLARLYGYYHERFWLHGDEPGAQHPLGEGLEKFRFISKPLSRFLNALGSRRWAHRKDSVSNRLT